MRAGVIVGAIVCALMLASAAQAQTAATSIVDEAARHLIVDPVYVHPESRAELSPGGEERVEDVVRDADAGPVYVAVLPEEAADQAGGDAAEVGGELYRTMQRDGTYAVVIGHELWAGSTEFPEGVVPRLAEETVKAEQGGSTEAVLLDFVDRLSDEASSPSGGGGGGVSFFWLLVIAGLGFFVVTRYRRRERERKLQEQRFEEVRDVAEEDLVALGEDLRSLELDIEMPGANPDAKKSYVEALECYERASHDLDRARSPQDLEPVSAALEEGRYDMAAARARLENRPLPERRAPCFFDPRHGPSARDVEWAPPSGAPRMVPACAEDARRVERGVEPQSREIVVDGQPTPYWGAPPYYGPWAGGYFGGFGLFEGLLLGSMLDGFGWGGGWGDGDTGGGDGDADVGGDFGGGDFGGGDFGGGDFGGGDFGGGDFGGGDFG